MAYTLHILFAQRAERYPGEYAPEALEVADEYAMEENPEWMDERVASHRATGEFESLAVVPVSVPYEAITAKLRPGAQVPVPGTVEG